MTKCSINFVLALGFAISSVASAGVVNSGGGVALVCRDSSAKIRSARLLDFVEAVEKGLALENKSSQEGYYRLFMDRWIETRNARSADESDEVLAGYIRDIESKYVFTGAGEVLDQLNDYRTNITVPAGCKLEQLAIFDDKALLIHVQTEIWNALKDQDKIGLIAHELIYQNTRSAARNVTSDCARGLVGEFFSTTPPSESYPEQDRCRR